MTYRHDPAHSADSGGHSSARRQHTARAASATRRRRVETPPGPGERPISQRQQAHREGRLSGSDILDRAVPRRIGNAAPPVNVRVTRVRGAGNARIRRAVHDSHGRARTNRRSADYPKLILRIALFALTVEVLGVLLFSHRFDVTRTVVNGNANVPTDHILNLMHVGPHSNIVRLPVGKLRKAILADPRIERATIHRVLPDKIQVAIIERTPWASVCLTGGDCYTIDRKFVPFRVAATAETGLPKLVLAVPKPSDGSAPAGVVLGQTLNVPGLDAVGACLDWAAREQFPVDCLEIAADGKLCLNETGGMQVQLGSSMILDRKLAALSTLLQRKPDLRDPNIGSSVAYVNLYDVDAPAIMPRAAQSAIQKTKAAELARNAGDSAPTAGDGTALPMTVQETSAATPSTHEPTKRP